MDDSGVERVLLVIDQIPRGRVATYADVGRVAGVGPRQVGAILRECVAPIAWWRVVNASGGLPTRLLPDARAAWADEGIPLKSSGRGCRLEAVRVDPDRLTADYRRALGIDE